MKASKDMREGVVHSTNNYGDIVIIKYHSCSKVDVEFVSSGFTTTAEAGDIRKGQVRDFLHRNIFGIGFFGVGRFKSDTGTNKTKAYSAWYNMLLRCYSETKPSRYKTYDDCIVCSEWHNFQVFAEWYNNNYPTDGVEYELDKDLLSTEIKVYSPSTCSFITGYENKKIAREVGYSLVSPSGDVFEGVNISNFSKENGLSSGHICSVLSGKRKHHKGWTKNEQ